jgi:hypothetical protein
MMESWSLYFQVISWFLLPARWWNCWLVRIVSMRQRILIIYRWDGQKWEFIWSDDYLCNIKYPVYAESIDWMVICWIYAYIKMFILMELWNMALNGWVILKLYCLHNVNGWWWWMRAPIFPCNHNSLTTLVIS